MKIAALILLAGAATAMIAVSSDVAPNKPAKDEAGMIILPKPLTKGQMSLEETLQKRRSRRQFSDQPLTLAQLGQLLWAAQGHTHPQGLRTAPSAGALYPMEVYAVVGKTEGLEPGVYHYEPSGHRLKLLKSGDLRRELQRACLGQQLIATAPVTVFIAADYSRTAKKYRQRAQRYVHIEAGHIGQNIYLQAESLHLGTCAVGAFTDSQMKNLLRIAEEPVYVMPVGVPAEKERTLEGK